MGKVAFASLNCSLPLIAFMSDRHGATFTQKRDYRTPVVCYSICSDAPRETSSKDTCISSLHHLDRGPDLKSTGSGICQDLHERRKETENPKDNEELRISRNKSMSPTVLS